MLEVTPIGELKYAHNTLDLMYLCIFSEKKYIRRVKKRL